MVRPDPRLVVRPLDGRPKVRKIFRIPGGALPRVFGVHDNNITNLVRGLTERVFNVEVDRPDGTKVLQPPPKPEPGAFASSLSTFRNQLRPFLPHLTPRTPSEVVATYEGDRRHAVYKRAAESLALGRVRQDDARLTTFVKAEKIDMAKGDPAPRVIQPRTPRYNVAVGCYVKHLEKPLYRAIGKLWGSTTVFKGLNGVERARELRKKWDGFLDPVAVGLDASRFDQHCSVDALKWEHSVYKLCFSDPADRALLGQLLSWQLVNRGVGRAWDGMVRYTVEGCRMSGDMNTALGNCLLMCAMVWTWLRQCQVTAQLANDGDDCVVVMERADLKRFQSGLREFFLQLGFTMKVEPAVDEFEGIEFCQCKPVWTERGWVMVRDPRKAMAKDLHSVLPLDDPRMALGLCTATGQGGLALCSGVPVCQLFYKNLVRLGRGVVIGRHPAMETGFARLCSGVVAEVVPISDAARISFWRAFGLLPSEQVLLEGALDLWTVEWNVERRESTADPQGFWQYY